MQADNKKHMLELPLNEVGEIQGTKEDVIMEFHVDDTAISHREDALCAVTFVVPDGNVDFPGTALFRQHMNLCDTECLFLVL